MPPPLIYTAVPFNPTDTIGGGPTGAPLPGRARSPPAHTELRATAQLTPIHRLRRGTRHRATSRMEGDRPAMPPTARLRHRRASVALHRHRVCSFARFKDAGVVRVAVAPAAPPNKVDIE